MHELPGSYCQGTIHPYYLHAISCPIAIVQQHRFVFYYWLKWAKELPYKKFITQNAPPALISFDWHRDIHEIQNSADLKRLNSDNLTDVALFTWFRLNPNNDGHILSAAYLNMIGDIYRLIKQGDDDSVVDKYEDMFGNIHHIFIHKSLNDLYRNLKVADTEVFYFDIDLDYFIESDNSAGFGVKSIASEEEIFSTLDVNSDFMRLIFPRLGGMTIATEPKWCGGLINSNYFLDGLNYSLFDGSLLSKDCYWRHRKDLQETEEES